MNYDELRRRDPASLVGARLQLHHAVHLATRPGRCFAEPLPDNGRATFLWESATQRLLSERTRDTPSWRVALRVCPLTLQLLVKGAAPCEWALTGRTLAETSRGLIEEAHRRGVVGETLLSELPYQIPTHAVAAGAPLDASEDDLMALAAWYDFGVGALTRWARGHTGAMPVRIGPRHLDATTHIAVDARAGRSIHAGFSPGDDTYHEPYFYVTCWPCRVPEPTAVPFGHWHDAGWSGVVLTAAELFRDADYAQHARQFLATATVVIRRRM